MFGLSNSILSFILFFIVNFFFISCEKNNQIDNYVEEEYYLTATLNNIDFISTQDSAGAYIDNKGNLFLIVRNNGIALVMTINNFQDQLNKRSNKLGYYKINDCYIKYPDQYSYVIYFGKEFYLNINSINIENMRFSGGFEILMNRQIPNYEIKTLKGSFLNLSYNDILLDKNISPNSLFLKAKRGSDKDFYYWHIINCSYVPSKKSILIKSTDRNVNYHLFELELDGAILKGQYLFNSKYILKNSYAYSSSSTANAYFGNLEILQHDTLYKRIRGTFNFSYKYTNSSSESLTLGEFDCSY